MRWKTAIPLIIFLVIVPALFVGLFLEPDTIPSARVGKPVPDFDLPNLYGGGRMTDEELAGGGVKLVNIFGSWCVPCLAEHPYLMELARRGVEIYAINYRDTPEGAQRFLETRGSPFTELGLDPEGRTAIDFGMSGVPETYVVNNEGRIIYQHVGPISLESLQQTILPLIEGEGGAE